jgi:Ca2+-transporting ATPase
MGFVVAVQIAIVQYGGAVFSTVPLSPGQWVTILIASASVLVIGFVLRVLWRLYQGTGPVSSA